MGTVSSCARILLILSIEPSSFASREGQSWSKQTYLQGGTSMVPRLKRSWVNKQLAHRISRSCRPSR